MNEVMLSDKELYVLWAIACWFDRPVVSSSLKYKLSGLASDPDRRKYERLYDTKIADRIIELGKWLEERRNKDE